MGAAKKFAALVVDFGGVLTTPLQDAMVAFATELGIDLQDFVRAALKAYAGDDDPLVVGFETGAIPESEFARQFAARLTEATGAEVAPEGLVNRIFSQLELEQTMIAAVEAAREAGMKTALLSNSWGDALYPQDLLDRIFDVVVISGRVGLRKPDPAIFELTLRELDVPARECLFVDDNPGHLKAAQQAGMTTLLHRSPEQTLEELERLLGMPMGAKRSPQR